MNKKEELQKYVEKRIRETGIGTPTIEQLNGFLAEWMQIENSRPIAHFDGYSPTQMQQIMHNLFGENCPVQLANFVDEDCKHSVMPVFDFIISWSMKVDFQKPPKHSESMWSF